MARTVVSEPIEFPDDDVRPMLQHLDRWAADHLVDVESWASMVERCDAWLEYSPRNQVLLASYGLVGPAAGMSTWENTESTDAGRPCVPQTGEHGVPVRVPVTDRSATRSGRSRPSGVTKQAVKGHRWERVFALEQLARRPPRAELQRPASPSMSEGDWCEALRRATGRLQGRVPRKVTAPDEQLTRLTVAVPLGPGRTGLDDVLSAQAAARVATLAGRPPATPPASFDPSTMSPRDRWRTLVDVRTAVAGVLRGVSHSVGVDLAASPLPRRDISDDREPAPGRRNYLSHSELQGLPLGVWSEAGPYSRSEWMARGIDGASGVSAFLRVNDRSYLAAYETGSGAMWRLETTGRGAHQGLVAEGNTESLSGAKDAAGSALADRFPDIAKAVDTPAGAPVVRPELGWSPLPGGRDDRTQVRVFDERVAAMVAPGPGGRWETWTTVDGHNRQGPLAPDAENARMIAEGLANGALLQIASEAPDRANATLSNLLDAGTFDRQQLATIIGPRLGDSDVSRITQADPHELVEHMSNAGVVSPSTMMRVLHTEGVAAETAAELVPAMGVPIPDGVRMLHDRWGLDRLDAGELLGATPDDLRDAGCTPREMLSAAPREVLRQLDTRIQSWEQAAAGLLEAGYTPPQAIQQLAAHAPTPETFAAAVEIVDVDPPTAFAVAGRRAEPEDLAALSERYQLSPGETADVMRSVSTPSDTAAEVLLERCDGDHAAASELLGVTEGELELLLERETPVVRLAAEDVEMVHIPDDVAGLDVQLPQPDLD